MGDKWIGNELEGSGRGLILSDYPDICLEGLKKTTKTLSQDNRSLGRNLSLGFTEYEAGVLTTRPRRSVWHSYADTRSDGQ
jgi:hypothetical protein